MAPVIQWTILLYILGYTHSKVDKVGSDNEVQAYPSDLCRQTDAQTSHENGTFSIRAASVQGSRGKLMTAIITPSFERLPTLCNPPKKTVNKRTDIGRRTRSAEHNAFIAQATTNQVLHFEFLFFLTTNAIVASASTTPTIPQAMQNLFHDPYNEMSELDKTKALLNTMFDGYDTRIRPRYDQSQPVVIRSSFVPLTVIELNTQEQIFTVNGYFRFLWADELLQQGMETHNQSDSIRVPINLMWIPKIKIYKDLYSRGLIGSPNTDIALIPRNLDVMWYPEGIYSVTCQVDITHYPYDKQNCTFTFYVDDEDASTVQLELLNQDITRDLSEFIDNAEWKLVEAKHNLRLDGNIYYIDYHFTMERREQFATFTLILPALTISLLCVCTFLVPIDSGEKGGLAMNVFLACCVYMTVLVDMLPHNSLTYSFFLLYITSLLCVSVFLVSYAIVESRVFHIQGDKRCTCFKRCLYKSGRTWKGVLTWLDTALFVLSSAVLICSYIFLTISTKE